MLSLLMGLLFVMVVIAVLLADMERKRKVIVDLLDQLAPMLDKSRRLTMANLRRLSRSPVHAYNLLDPLEREISLLETENDVAPDDTDSRRGSIFAGSRLANFQERIQTLTAVLGKGTTPAPARTPTPREAVQNEPEPSDEAPETN